MKALLACLEAEKGSAVADEWLKKLRLARTDLEDETRLLPLSALRAALESLNERVPDGIEKCAAYFAARDNLGSWARVLRGTRAPEDALARMESGESEHGRTTRWETLERRDGYWKGKVHLSHDPSIEEDGLLAKSRVVELSVVPTLFGYARGEVTQLSKDEDAQEFEVRWALPSARKGIVSGLVTGGIVGAVACSIHSSPATMAVAALAPLAGAAAGLFWSKSQVAKIETAAQTIRVNALERSLALRESSSSRNASGDLEGTMIAGQYRIGPRMGSGASGVIYEATRLTDGHAVAIKLLRAATAHDVSASDRLRRESEALGLSWHPNVVEVIDHGHLPDGTSYLIMELLRGEMLATRLKYRVRLTPKELLPVAKQVTEALVAIHAAGVVHRDLKPSNIYLVPDEEMDTKERVKVFDFGIARVEWEEMRITNIGAPMGTPGYMSPEQETGGEVDGRSDIYAAGALFYECLVGEPPPVSAKDMWKPNTRPPSSYAIRLAEEGSLRADSGVQPASRRMPSAAPAAAPEVPGPVDAPPGWRALIERALAKDASERFQDARALLSAIRALDPSSVTVAVSDTSSTGSDKP